MRTTISQRIGIGLLILILLQICVLIVIRTEVGRYRDSTAILNSYVIPSASTLSAIESQQLASFSDTLQYVVTGIPSHLEESTNEELAVKELLAQLRKLQAAAPNTVAERIRVIDALEQSLESASARIRVSRERYQRGEQIDLAAFARDIDQSENEALSLVTYFNTFLVADREAILNTTRQDPLLLPGIIGILALLVAIGVLLFITRPMILRLNRLGTAALRIAAGEHHQEVRIEGTDEIADLAQALNTMLSQVAAQQQALAERATTLEEAITSQKQLLATVQSLSVPAIPVGAQVLALPLIGYLDAPRMQQIIEELLDTVHRERANTVLIDVTGLAIVDQAAARFLMQLVTSVTLLGAHGALTGINANLAQTLVALNMDLSKIQVYPTLREGIAASL